MSRCGAMAGRGADTAQGAGYRRTKSRKKERFRYLTDTPKREGELNEQYKIFGCGLFG